VTQATRVWGLACSGLVFCGSSDTDMLVESTLIRHRSYVKKGKGSPYSITERRLPGLIPVLGSHPAGDVSHKPGGRLPLLSTRPAVTLTTFKRAATNFAAGEQRHNGCDQFA